MDLATSSNRDHDAQWRARWDVQGTVDWIEARGFIKVALQFPDELLQESTLVAAAVQQECSNRDIAAQVFLLADTSYNSLSVDEVTAQHANADCVVHYGRASRSPLSCLSAYFVFGKQELDSLACAQRIAQYAADKALEAQHKFLLVFLDQNLLHAVDQVQQHIYGIQQDCAQTLQIAFATIGQQSMDPFCTPAQAQTQSSSAACSCKKPNTATTSSAAPTNTASATEAPQPPEITAADATSSAPTSATSATEARGSCDGTAASADASFQPASPSLRGASSAANGSHNATDGTMAIVMNTQSPQSDDMKPELDSNTLPQLDAERSRLSQESSTSGSSGTLAGYSWQLPPGMQQEDGIMVWVGPDDVPTLTHLHLAFNKLHWAMYDPESNAWQEGLPRDISKTLKRRYFLVEKAKNANVIGILVGTLGVAGYKDAIESIRDLAKAAGKKTYTMLMGKPNPAKLANFPEVEVFVMVADPQGMILDSKEYYAPIITPFEAHLAFSEGAEWTGDYSLDFSSLQGHDKPGTKPKTARPPRFSLLDSAYHTNGDSDVLGDGMGNGAAPTEPDTSHALAVRADQALQLKGRNNQVVSASEFLQKRRTYRGLEAPIVGAEKKPVVKAAQGQTGRAAQYEHESSL